MKVLLINGSPHAKGNTAVALEEMVKVFQEEGIETDILHIGNKAIRGCIACRQCAKLGHCLFDDEVNAAAPKLAACDGLVIASPVYYASANATLNIRLKSGDKTGKSRTNVELKQAGSYTVWARGLVNGTQADTLAISVLKTR